jgi:hypothetical protein
VRYSRPVAQGAPLFARGCDLLCPALRAPLRRGASKIEMVQLELGKGTALTTWICRVALQGESLQEKN